MLINKAIKAYTEDLSLDQNFITSKESKSKRYFYDRLLNEIPEGVGKL